MASVTPLDPVELKEAPVVEEKKKFYIQVHDLTINDSKTYGLDRHVAALSGFFRVMIESNPDEGNTASTAVNITTSHINQDPSLAINYSIHTIQLFDFVTSYMDYWANQKITRHNKMDYIKEGIVCSSDASHVLNEFDCKLINNIITCGISKIPGNELQRVETQAIADEKLPSDDPNKLYGRYDTYMKYKKVQMLAPAIAESEFLRIPSLSSKLYAYVATILYQCDLNDISVITNDPYFANLQRRKIEEYKKHHADKFRLPPLETTPIPDEDNTSDITTTD